MSHFLEYLKSGPGGCFTLIGRLFYLVPDCSRVRGFHLVNIYRQMSDERFFGRLATCTESLLLKPATAGFHGV